MDRRLERELQCGRYHKIMVVGAIDTGKTWLSLSLAQCLTEAGLRVGIMDLDLGQSSVGPPGVAGLQLPWEPAWSPLFPTALVFLGYLSPAWDIRALLEAAEKLESLAIEFGFDVLIIDTSGMVMGEFAALIKRSKIRKLQPELVISLERKGETRHIFEDLERSAYGKLTYLAPAPEVMARGREDRARYRSELYDGYFSSPVEVTPKLGRIKLVTTSGRIPGGLSFLEKDHLLGLNDSRGFTLSLARLLERKGKALRLMTPYRGALKEIAAIAVGPSRIDDRCATSLIELDDQADGKTNQPWRDE